MTELELSQFRLRFNILKQERDLLVEEHKELKELLKDEKVQRYIELMQINYDIHNDEELAEKAFNSEVTSNNIMVYMGTYIYDVANDYLTYDDDPEGMYKSYMDLETEQVYSILVDECKKFEERNTVIYIPVSICTANEYSKNYLTLKKWFLLELTMKHQEIVIGELKKLNEVKYKNLYLATHKYPEVVLDRKEKGSLYTFDVDTFIKTYPENGFIENFCLTDEERKLVRLSRKDKK